MELLLLCAVAALIYFIVRSAKHQKIRGVSLRSMCRNRLTKRKGRLKSPFNPWAALRGTSLRYTIHSIHSFVHS